MLNHRFREWVAAQGPTLHEAYKAAAEKLRCSDSTVAKLYSGDRGPSVAMAHAIESATASLEGGPVRTESWVDEPAKAAS